jgi:hypothetical protein
VPIGFTVTEPAPADPSWPRYSARPFPSYRFIPGKNPHPRRDPGGHSYGKPEPTPSALRPDEWQQSEEYLYGIDLYNFAFWWECHEVFEGLWHAVGHDTEQGNFFQALIQLAAANIKNFCGNHRAAEHLLTSGIVRLQKTPKLYMGIDVAKLTQDVQQHVVGSDFHVSLICLQGRKTAC